MKKHLFILLSAISLTAFAQQKKVAVYVTGDDAGIKKVLGSKLVRAIGFSEEYAAIERTESFLAELGKEQDYQYSGEVDDSELSRLGKQFGVQYICVADVSEAFNEKYLSARLIDVETAQVERTASSSGAIQSLEGIVNAANSISNDLFASLDKEKTSESKKVAVYIIKNEAGKDIGRVLGDKLVAGFANSGRYIAVERTKSFLIKHEQMYQSEGTVNDEEIAKIGKQFGVQYVCVAEVSEVFGEKFISAHLIDVETAEIVNSYDAGGTINDMNSCLEIANDIASHLSNGTFSEQVKEARIKAEKDEQIKKQQEQQEQIQETAETFAEAVVGLVNVLTKGSADPTYTITFSNYKNSTYKIHFGNTLIGYVKRKQKVTFTVPQELYGTLTATQQNGYVLYPTVIKYSIPKQTTHTNIELNIKQ